MPPSWLGRRWTWRDRFNATLVLIIATGLVALLTATVVNAIVSQRDAVASLNRARTLTARRIDLLNAEINHLSAQGAHAARQRGELLAEVGALSNQLRQLGVTPVAAPTVAHPAPSSQPRPPSSTRPRSTSSSRTTPPRPRPSSSSPRPTRSPQPTPTRTCLLTVAGICVRR